MQFQVMAKPCGAACNLRCTYCFYTEKTNLYGDPAPLRMPPEILDSFIHQYIDGQDTPEIQFTWQGGEPTLLGIAFFSSVVSLQGKYAEGRKVTNTIQTNGIRLTDDWCRFFKEHGFLVGLSIDGPRELHDRYRIRAQGGPTFDAVMTGAALLRRHEVAFNTLTVINDRKAYKAIFTHMAIYLDIMVSLIQAGRTAPDIIGVLQQQGRRGHITAPGRNAPCPCGSGQKYKRCCGA